jgi:hypothetical protein
MSINHHICPIFYAENNLSKLQFNFAHFIGPILTIRGATSLEHLVAVYRWDNIERNIRFCTLCNYHQIGDDVLSLYMYSGM